MRTNTFKRRARTSRTFVAKNKRKGEFMFLLKFMHICIFTYLKINYNINALILGRILNRFARDTGLMDDQLPLATQDVLEVGLPFTSANMD